MLTPNQREIVKKIENTEHESGDDPLHPIERHWVQQFKNKFDGEGSKDPCQMSLKVLALTYQKAVKKS